MVSLLSRVSLSLLILLLFFGCVFHQNYKTTPSTILFKTPQYKYYDTGFIQSNDFHTIVNLYNSGQTILNIDIMENRVCFNQQCMSGQEFNKMVLNENYPDNLVLHLFKGEKIFEDLNVKYQDGKITQEISNQNVDILYQIEHKIISFDDKKNNIKIVIKGLE